MNKWKALKREYKKTMDNNAQTGSEKNMPVFFSNLGNSMDIRAVLNPHIHCLQECEKTTRQLQKIEQVKMLISRTQRILKILIRPSAVLVSRGRNSLNAGVVFSLHCLSLKNTQKTGGI